MDKSEIGMIDFLQLSEMEDEEQELIPEILPVDARLSLQGNAEVLLSLFQSALDVVPIKEIIPNTGYILLEGVEQTSDHSSHVKVTATDGERTITLINSSMSVKLSGSLLVPGKRFRDILRLIGDNLVKIEVLGTSASLRAGRAVWTVSTPPVEAHLPVFSDVEDMTLHTVRTDELLKGLELSYPAIARTSARQSLMQVRVEKGTLTSCDGVRAHKVSVPSLHKSVSTTLPLSFVESAIKELRGHKDEYVEFGSDHSAVVIHFGSNILMSQRLNFSYPDVDHLMLGPALLNDEVITVNVKELSEAIKRVRVNSDPEYFALYLSLRKVKGEWNLTVRARDKEGNSSIENVSASFEGTSPSRDLTVNHKHFLEFLNCVDDEEVELKLGEYTKTKQAPIYVSGETFTGSLMLMSPSFVR